MSEKINLLIVEDSEYDSRVIIEILKKNKYLVDYTHVSSSESMKKAFKKSHFDLIISDYTMPGFDGMQALEIAQTHAPDVPFIIVSGTIGEETAVHAMKSGASDYIMKENLRKLFPAVKNVLEKSVISKELREIEIKYSHLFNSMLEAISVTDNSRKVINVNPQFLVLFGYEQEEILKKSSSLFFKNEKDFKEIGIRMQNLEEKKLLVNTIELIKKNGESFLAEVRTYPMYNSEGVKYGNVSLIRDITESKRIESELIHAKEKAEESDKLKSAFMDNMSHEIRTPLNAIIGFSQLLSMPDLKEEEKEEFISLINSRGSDLVRIISEVLEISKIEAETIELSKDPCNLNELLAETEDKINKSLLKKERLEVNIHIAHEPKPENYLIITDIEKLRIILINLVDNALKFTHKGVVNVSFQNSTDNRDLIEFHIKDSGIGIPESKMPIIFDIFRQVDDSHTRQYGGVGLGLSICKKLIEKLGGHIIVESEVDKGTLVKFMIPHNRHQLAEQMEKGYLDHPDWSDKKLLVVEDNMQNYLFIEMVIKNTGIQISWAQDGKEAMDIVQKSPEFDLVLMDLQLPKMSGIEVTKNFRDHHITCPIIAQTAFNIPTHFNDMYRIEFDDYLRKPFSKEILLKTIQKHLFTTK
ncbi:MAG: response regulator [Bacteroidetes bacterium]|nr:response regulator [Bacteroidota bacterium]